MDFISDWALVLIFILALTDRPAAILTVSLLIATRMTGPIESTITVLLGMTTLTIGLWLLNKRLKKNVEDLLISPCDYTIGQWLKNHGIVKTVLLTDFAFAWKFKGVLGLATASNGRWSVCGGVSLPLGTPNRLLDPTLNTSNHLVSQHLLEYYSSKNDIARTHTTFHFDCRRFTYRTLPFLPSL